MVELVGPLLHGQRDLLTIPGSSHLERDLDRLVALGPERYPVAVHRLVATRGSSVELPHRDRAIQVLFQRSDTAVASPGETITGVVASRASVALSTAGDRRRVSLGS